MSPVASGARATATAVFFFVTATAISCAAIFVVIKSVLVTFAAFTIESAREGAGLVHKTARLAAQLFLSTFRKIRAGIRTGVAASSSKLDRLAANLRPTTVTLSLEDGFARIVVFSGTKIIAWKKAAIEPPAYGPVQEPEEGRAEPKVSRPLGTLLDALAADTNLRIKRVVTDLPLYLPLLRHVPLPKVKGRYQREIIHAEVMETIPFGPGEIDLFWSVHQSVQSGSSGRERSREASVVAVPRGPIDSQVQLITDSGLSLKAAYTGSAALAVAVGIPDVVVVHLNLTQGTLVMVREGIPRVVHQVEFAGRNMGIDDQAAALAFAVDQVSGYQASELPKTGAAALPVVFTGELSGRDSLLRAMAKATGRPVQPYHAAGECPDGMATAEYAANIGLFQAARPKPGGQGKGRRSPALNVLPERHRPRPLPLAPAGAFAALLVLAMLAFNLTGWVSNVASEAGALAAKLDIREEQARDYRLAVARVQAFTRRTDEASLEAQELDSTLDDLKLQMETLLERLESISALAASNNVQLNRMAPEPNGFSIVGGATTHAQVLAYAAALRAAPEFENATVQQVANAAEGRLSFTVLALVPQPPEPSPELSDKEAGKGPQ
jgi:hypothetical protein